MFAIVRDFLYRHRRKFLVGGALVGGLVFLSRYAERKFYALQDSHTQSLLERQKKRQHYENTWQTANATVMSLAGTLKEVVGKELDADALLQAIRETPEHKLLIWEQLKAVGFSRAISVVYTGALVTSAVQVQLMVLGGYTYAGTISHSGVIISPQLQQRYLATMHHLLETGLPELIRRVNRVTTQVVAGVPLSRSLTVGQVEALLHQIRLGLMGEIDAERTPTFSSSATGSGSRSFRLEQWSRYVLPPPFSSVGEEHPDDQILSLMLVETKAIIDHEDFTTVVQRLVQVGIEHVLDRVAEFYPSTLSTSVDCPSGESTQSWVDKLSRSASPKNPQESDPPVAPRQVGAVVTSPFAQSTLPVAKIVPVLTGTLHGALSPTPGQLLHKLLQNEKLVAMAGNVYEAFASVNYN